MLQILVERIMKKEIKPIRTEAEYKEALKNLQEVFFAEEGTPEFDRAEILGILIENYESKYYPIEDPDPIEAIKYLMEENNMNQNDLGEILGGKSKASLILNKKRALSISMIRNLHKKLKIPLDVLFMEYPIASYILFIATFLVAFF